MCEGPCVLHGGDQSFGRRMKNAALTEIFRQFSLICYS